MLTPVSETEYSSILDTETTGFDPVENRIIEIGIVRMQGFKKISEKRWLLDPLMQIPAEATKVHGITDAMVRGMPTFEDIATDLLDYIEDTTLVIHNAEFDMRFLNHELANIGLPPLRNKVKDTIKISRTRFPGSPANIDALCKRFKIDNTRALGGGYHGALIDAQLLSQIWVELEGGRQSNLFTGVAPAAAVEETIAAAMPGRIARIIRASDAEIAAHTAFVGKEVKNAIWSRA